MLASLASAILLVSLFDVPALPGLALDAAFVWMALRPSPQPSPASAA